jgi:hypothetical protein
MEKEQKKDDTKMRQIIIETDGSSVKIAKFEAAGSLEFKAILIALLEKIK